MPLSDVLPAPHRAFRAALILVCLFGAVAPLARGQTAEGMPCREEDDPPASFEHRGVQVTIDKSCWKRQVGKDCSELVKGWSTEWVATSAKSAIDSMYDAPCLGEGIRGAVQKRLQKLRVLCKPSSTQCGWAILNSQTLTLGTLVADKKRCIGSTMTHEMLHAHAGLSHTAQCVADVPYSCDQSCFKRNTCNDCATGGVCTPNYDAVHADLCKTR